MKDKIVCFKDRVGRTGQQQGRSRATECREIAKREEQGKRVSRASLAVLKQRAGARARPWLSFSLELCLCWLEPPIVVLNVLIKEERSQRPARHARNTHSLPLQCVAQSPQSQLSFPPPRCQRTLCCWPAAATCPCHPNQAVCFASSFPDLCVFHTVSASASSHLALFCLQFAPRVSLFIRSF